MAWLSFTCTSCSTSWPALALHQHFCFKQIDVMPDIMRCYLWPTRFSLCHKHVSLLARFITSLGLSLVSLLNAFIAAEVVSIEPFLCGHSNSSKQKISHNIFFPLYFRRKHYKSAMYAKKQWLYLFIIQKYNQPQYPQNGGSFAAYCAARTAYCGYCGLRTCGTTLGQIGHILIPKRLTSVRK